MSAWPEAIYIINKIEDTLLEVQSFDEQIEEIRGANNRIVELEIQANGYDDTLNEYGQQIDQLRTESAKLNEFIDSYQESDVENLGAKIEAIETNLKAKEQLIAFKDTRSGEVHTKVTSTGCIWFIVEEEE